MEGLGPGAEGGGEDTHQRGKGRWRHNETRVHLNRQSAGTEANGVEEHSMRAVAAATAAASQPAAGTADDLAKFQFLFGQYTRWG